MTKSTAPQSAEFRAAIKWFLSRLKKIDGRSSYYDELDVVYGPRWAKVLGISKNRQTGAIISRSALYFIDTNPGTTYGWVKKSAAWNQPAKGWMMDSIVAGRRQYIKNKGK